MRHHRPEARPGAPLRIGEDRPAAPPRIGAACPSVLFVHDRGPGQFGALGRHLASRGWPVTFAATREVAVPGCAALVYAPHRAASAQTHPYAQAFDRAALNAQGFARAALAARRDGLAPDIVVSHAGPGAGLVARDVFPRARTVAYAEWWYAHPAPDLAWLADLAGPAALAATEQAMIEHTRNAAVAPDLAGRAGPPLATAEQATVERTRNAAVAPDHARLAALAGPPPLASAEQAMVERTRNAAVAPDLGWLPDLAGPPLAPAEQAMVERTRNAAMALEIASADATICPTAFQARQFPAALQPAITIHHDGIDTDLYSPAPAATDDAACPAPLSALPPGTPLVTYATRGMEPHRGFPQFMAALPEIQRANPGAVVAIAGENRVAYGTDAMRRVDWLAHGLATPGLDPTRVVLLGPLAPASYRWLLRRSDAHVYLTVPFVLSWSMLEAMATACPLVLSDTDPVREVAGPAHALLADLRDPSAIATAVTATLADPAAARLRGAAARRAILRRYAAAQAHAEKADLLRQL